jgi:hypothetical protein
VEGAFLRQTRVEITYALHKKLKEKVNLGVGVAVRAINYRVLASSISGGGSGFSPNINMGIWLYDPKNYELGVSMNQINNGELQPIESIYSLRPYIHFFGSKAIDINYQFSLNL